MDLSMTSIDEMMKGLPFYAQLEVRDFVTFLRAKYIRNSTRPLRQDWAGGLSYVGWASFFLPTNR